MPGTRDPAVQLLLDRAAIEDLTARYAIGVDRRDWGLVASCFSPDVAGGWGRGDWHGRDELMQYIEGVARFHSTVHFMGNQLIDVHDDLAQSDRLAMLVHRATRRDGSEFEHNPSGREYHERLARVGGEWLIVERGVEPRWTPSGVVGVATEDAAVRWLLDRAEIQDLMMQYAIGVDLRDYDRIQGCFAATFSARYGDREFSDLAALTEFIRGVERFASTTHFLGLPLIEIDRDRASMETPALITHRNEDESEFVGGSGRYRDALVRDEGRWLFAARGAGTPRVGGRGGAPRSSAGPAVQRLLDRAQIRDLTTRVAVGLDRRDIELARACMAPDFRAVVDAVELPSAEAFLDHCSEDLARWHDTKHLLGQQLIEVGGDEATAETYACVTHRERAGGAPTDWARGARRFLDRFRRDGDGWLIVERRIEGPYVRRPPDRGPA